MSDVFLSYASADRDRAQRVAEHLAHAGYDVWWDRTIPPGRVFDEVIQEALNAAKCVVVLWSVTSVRSNWVKTEAAEASAHNRLVPAFIDRVDAPIEFKRIQAADLSAWDGSDDHPEFRSLLASIARLVKAAPSTARAGNFATSDPAESRPAATRRSPKVVAALAILAVAVVVGVLSLRTRSGLDTPSTSSRPPSPAPTAGSAAATAAQPGSAPSVSASSANVPVAAASSAGSISASIAAPSGTVNLLAAENGGELLVASHPKWANTIDGKEDTYAWVDNGSAVFGFKDGRAATFDTFAVLIPEQSDNTLRDFELLAGNDSPTGAFRLIGTFSTQNVRVMKHPFQEFHFAPVTARYLKVHALKSHAGSSTSFAYEFALYGRLQ